MGRKKINWEKKEANDSPITRENNPEEQMEA